MTRGGGMKGFWPANRLIVFALGAVVLTVLVAAIRSTEGDVAAPSVLSADQSPACTSCDARHKHLTRMAPALEKDPLP
jgi:hypothetical protein